MKWKLSEKLREKLGKSKKWTHYYGSVPATSKKVKGKKIKLDWYFLSKYRNMGIPSEMDTSYLTHLGQVQFVPLKDFPDDLTLIHGTFYANELLAKALRVVGRRVRLYALTEDSKRGNYRREDILYLYGRGILVAIAAMTEPSKEEKFSIKTLVSITKKASKVTKGKLAWEAIL